METNQFGFILKDANGAVIAGSLVSASSGKKLDTRGTVTRSVPGTPGLYYRLKPLEERQLSSAQHEVIQDRARAWLRERYEAAQDKAADLIQIKQFDQPESPAEE